MKLPIDDCRLPIERQIDGWMEMLHVRFGIVGRVRLWLGRRLVKLGKGIARRGGALVIQAVNAARFEWGRPIDNRKSEIENRQC